MAYEQNCVVVKLACLEMLQLSICQVKTINTKGTNQGQLEVFSGLCQSILHTPPTWKYSFEAHAIDYMLIILVFL